MTPKQIARFWARVDKSGECWVWTGARAMHGYGQARYDGRDMGAHRIAYILSYGAIPPGLFICHHCDNPPCVNPAHLFAGTQQENIHDAFMKGRPLGKPLGGPGANQLTLAAAQEIRALHAAGVSGVELARRYQVSPHTVYRVLAGRTWIEDPQTRRLRTLKARRDQRINRRIETAA